VDSEGVQETEAGDQRGISKSLLVTSLEIDSRSVGEGFDVYSIGGVDVYSRRDIDADLG